MKILSLSHNAYWWEIEQLEKYREDIENITITGRDSYWVSHNNDKRFDKDFDVILCYSSFHYNKNEEDNLIEFASGIARKSGKKVSIGYSYVIPNYERENPNISDGVKFISIENRGVHQEDVEQNDKYFTILDLADIMINKHNEKNKCKTKVKNREVL